MTRIAWLFLPLIFLLSSCGAHDGPEGSSPTPQGAFKVLVYSRTAGFRHTSIEPGQLAIQQLGQTHDFAVDLSEDPTVFTADNLAQYAVVVWLNTTLTVLDTADQRQAFEDFIAAGGGYVGIHSAADTEYDWPFYEELVGAHFLAHPVVNQPGTLIVEAPDHPSVAHLDGEWSLPIEEFYSFRSNPREQTRILLHIDEGGYIRQPNTSCDPTGATFPQGYSANMGDHPMSWCHDNLGGRAWYTALGHSEYLYTDAAFLEHILQGILTAAGRVDADCAVKPAPANTPVYEPPVLEGCENLVVPG